MFDSRTETMATLVAALFATAISSVVLSPPERVCAQAASVSTFEESQASLRDAASRMATEARERFGSEPRLAVLPFFNSDASSPCRPRTILRDDVVEAMDTAFPEIVARADEDFADALAELDAQQTAAFDPATAARVGSRLGAEAVLVGRVSVRQDPNGRVTYRLQLRIVTVEEARIVSTESVQIHVGYVQDCEQMCTLAIVNNLDSRVDGQVGAQTFSLAPGAQTELSQPFGRYSLSFRVGRTDPRHIEVACEQLRVEKRLDPTHLSGRQAAGWVVFGTGLATAASAVAPMVIRRDAVRHYNSVDCAPRTDASGTPLNRDQVCGDASHAIVRTERAIIGLAVAGGTAVVTGLVMGLLPSGDRTPTTRPTAMCVPTFVETAGVACIGRF